MKEQERGWILMVANTIVITFMGMLVLQSASVDARLQGLSETQKRLATLPRQALRGLLKN